jgi:hypothetical protein
MNDQRHDRVAEKTRNWNIFYSVRDPYARNVNLNKAQLA